MDIPDLAIFLHQCGYIWLKEALYGGPPVFPVSSLIVTCLYYAA